MQILFLHQNFPGQFKHLAPFLLKQGHRVVGLGEWKYIEERYKQGFGFPVFGYTVRPSRTTSHHYLSSFEAGIRRGQDVVRACMQLKKNGIRPDVVIGHPGWGELLFIKDVFPEAKLIAYLEFFYQSSGSDIGFDAEFPSRPDDHFKLRIRNSLQLHALACADVGVSPTDWQRSTYPSHEHSRIEVIHEGVNLDLLRPDAAATFRLPDARLLTRNDSVVTFVSRQLEPYRGFHIFMRALPELQRRLPQAQFVIVGGDGVSYGRHPPAPFKTYREMLMQEVGGSLDMTRIHFVGRIPYASFIQLLQTSRLHIYLTYPFVLSWSLLEAMACGAPVLASRTAPVEEVITDGVQGRLVDFFDWQSLVEVAAQMLCRDTTQYTERARALIQSRYSLQAHSLPRYRELVSRLEN